MTSREAVERFAEGLNTGVLVTDGALDNGGPTIVYANSAMESLTGYPRDELLGATPRIFQGKATSRFTLKALSDALRAGRPFHTCLTNYRADGEPYLCEIDIRPLRGPDGQIDHFVAFEREVVRRRVRVRPGQNARFRTTDAAAEAEADGPLAPMGCFATPLD
ncbi:MAG: PAS domain-containing protein [Microvirga sp.]|nr:PAS domain-containing protein [Microvirga sp.]